MKISIDSIVYKSSNGIKMHINPKCPTILYSKISKITVGNGKEKGMSFCKVCSEYKNGGNEFKDKKDFNTNKEYNKKQIQIITNKNSQKSEKSILSYNESYYILKENINSRIRTEEQRNKNASIENYAPQKGINKYTLFNNSIDDRVLSEIVGSLDETKLSTSSNISSMLKIYLQSNFSLYYSDKNDLNLNPSNTFNYIANNKYYYCLSAKATKKENKNPIRLCIGYSIYDISDYQNEGNFSVERYFYNLKLDNINRLLYIILDFENQNFIINEKEQYSMKQIYKINIYYDQYTQKAILPYINIKQYDKVEIIPNKED